MQIVFSFVHPASCNLVLITCPFFWVWGGGAGGRWGGNAFSKIPWIHAKPCLSKGNLGSVTTWLSLWFCPCSPVAETEKSGFRSTHELEKVWQLILLDQYLLSNVHYVVKSKSGIRSERKGGFSTLPLRRGENEVVKCMTFCLLLFLTPLSTFAVQIPT